MITAKNIIKSFGDTPVLQGLDLDIKRGDIFGLAGRSGEGKSTLLRCINGLENYDSGSLIVDGVDVKGLSIKDMMAFRKNIGMIFQNFSLLERLTVYDNIALPLRCWKYKSGFIDKKVKELLDVVGIPEKLTQKPRELSGGQKQRVAIARALAMDAHILLCDEATSALDPKTTKSIISLLKQINRQMGITIVFVTHQMSVLRGLCSEIAILENGKAAVSGLTEDIFQKQPAALKNLIGEEIIQDSPATAALALPDTAASFITGMAMQIGIDLTIQGGESGISGVSPRGLVISFRENAYQDVEQYLNRHNITWRKISKYENNTEPSEEREKKYPIPASLIQPEIL